MAQGVNEEDYRWLVCVHVLDGKAAEVWCRPDRIAVCRDCAVRGEEVPDEDLRVVCPACLIGAARRVPLILGREYLERDGIVGHIGHN
jgi:hypothetical protein